MLNTPQQVNSSTLNPVVLSNGLAPSSSSVDAEMVEYLSPNNLSEIASRPGLLTIFPMTAADAIGKTLFSVPVHPCSGIFQVFANGEMHYMTPIRYVSWPCKYWYGSIKYKLQIVASNFHSGRLQILYTPMNANTPTTTSTDVAFEQTSHIVDLQCDSEIEFEIPWNSHYPVLALDKEAVFEDSANGTLAFRVLNQLTYKETPIPDIEFNLWVSAGSNFKLFNMHAPITFDLTTPTTVVDGGKAQVADTSKMTAKSSAEAIVPLVMGNAVETCSAIQEVNLRDAFATSSPVVILNKDEQFKEGNLRLISSTTKTQLFSDIWNTAFQAPDTVRNVIISFPYYDWYNLMFRFRRGDYTYSVFSIDMTDPAGAVTSSKTMIASAGIMDVSTSAHTYRATYVQLKNLLCAANLPTVMSSDGPLQPLCLRLPYSSSAKLAITDCATGSSSDIYPEFNKANVISIAVQRCQNLVFRSVSPDMKFYFQVGPPSVFVAN
jgi:hypothetical protein